MWGGQGAICPPPLIRLGVGAGHLDTVPGPLLGSMNLVGSLGTLCAMGDAQALKGLKEVYHACKGDEGW